MIILLALCEMQEENSMLRSKRAAYLKISDRGLWCAMKDALLLCKIGHHGSSHFEACTKHIVFWVCRNIQPCTRASTSRKHAT